MRKKAIFAPVGGHSKICSAISLKQLSVKDMNLGAGFVREQMLRQWSFKWVGNISWAFIDKYTSSTLYLQIQYNFRKKLYISKKLLTQIKI